MIDKVVIDPKGYCVKVEIDGRPTLIDGDNPYQLRRRIKEVVNIESEESQHESKE